MYMSMIMWRTLRIFPSEAKGRQHTVGGFLEGNLDSVIWTSSLLPAAFQFYNGYSDELIYFFFF